MPRKEPKPWSAPILHAASTTALRRDIRTPKVSFLHALDARTSRTGGDLDASDLSSVLWHATSLRTRHPCGRFGLPWESRPAPSAGGLHPIRILCLPIGPEEPCGLYEPEGHGLQRLAGPDAARALNAANVLELTGATAGTTLQLAADWTKLDACYHDAGSLMWRDAGALAATITLVAAALGVAAVTLGRHGTPLLRSAGLPSSFVGVGAVHLGSVVAGAI